MKFLNTIADQKDLATKEFVEALPIPDHTHGNITDDGKIGSVANLPIFTGTNGVLETEAILTALAYLGVGRGTCSTEAGTVAKVGALANFAINGNGIVVIKFTNANTANNPTLNINSTGAKPIYFNGTNITSTMITAGMSAIFAYNGTQYELLNPNIEVPSGLLVSGLSLPTSGYSGSGPYTKTFTVTGATTDASKVYVIIPIFSDTDATRTLERTAWNLIVDNKVTSANTLTVTVSAVPDTAVAFIFKEVL